MGKRIKGLLLGLLLCLTSLAGFINFPVEAFADGGVVVKLHYHRTDGNYADWSVWFWEEGKDGVDTPFSEENGEMVATCEPTPGTLNLGFIVRTPDWGKDVDADQYIDISEMISGTVDVYVESGVKGYEKEYGADAVKGTKLKTAKYDGEKTIEIKMTGEIAYDYSDAFEIKDRNGIVGINGVEHPSEYVYTLSLETELVPMRNYVIKYEEQWYSVIMPNIYSTEQFEKDYTYSGSDLGATWTPEKTSFRVWAPTAETVSLRLYATGDSKNKDMQKEIDMQPSESGTWTAEVEEDLNGVYYTYYVTVDGRGKEACDPYARTTGINGERAMVIDLDSTDPEGWESDVNPHAGEKINDAIIYEAHIRDLTTEEGAGFEHVGKYLGVAETDTATADGLSTGMSHIKELGVTHLHILPFYDFGSVDERKTVTGIYNWGYDPVNYNVPEGSYSTDAQNGEVRVKEVKKMVKSLHDNGISVVMDVVYNHVQDGSNFCFNRIVPGYFSRINETGAYSSGSGCGNDTASERSMVRKYIVESVNYWADEYHIDGFRFDLVGLLDTDTINEIVDTVHKNHPDVIFYGEGWTMNTEVTKDGVVLATQTNSELTPGFAFFNDTIRDGIKGSVFNTGKGFVSGSSGDAPKIARCFSGLDTWCKSPSQTVNYASCHDNNTLIDRLALARPDASYDELVAMNKLSASIYMTAEGIPFMQAGEEILRTKTNADGSYNSNSYNAGDAVNAITYSAKSDETVNSVFEYYKGLIAFRKAHSALRISDAQTSGKAITNVDTGLQNCLAFAIDGACVENEISDKLFVVFNAEPEAVSVDLPEGDWKVCIDKEHAGTAELSLVSGSVSVEAVSAMVLVLGENEPAAQTEEIWATDNGSVYEKKNSPLVLIISLLSAGALIAAGLIKLLKK